MSFISYLISVFDKNFSTNAKIFIQLLLEQWAENQDQIKLSGTLILIFNINILNISFCHRIERPSILHFVNPL